MYENTKASTCDYETSVFYMDDVFKVLRKLDVYAKGFRTMPVGSKTKLNSGLAFKVFSILKSQNGCHTSVHDLICPPPAQYVEMKHGEEISQLVNRRDSCLHRNLRLSMCSSRV